MAICDQVKRNIPNKIENLSKTHSVLEFKNINGEGITSKIKIDNKTLNICCGNLKLMNRFNILSSYKEIAQQITYLEEEGKTVVVLAIDNIPSLIISLEEAELSKPEAKHVV